MFKKVALVAVALAIAAPVFAGVPNPPDRHEGGTTISNYGVVTNNVATVANTGANLLSSEKKIVKPTFLGFGGGPGGSDEKSGSITTGDAYAYADVTGQANYSEIACNTCSSSGKLAITNNGIVTNNVLTIANTGLNKSSGGNIKTGDATAYSFVVGTVNTTIVGSVVK